MKHHRLSAAGFKSVLFVCTQLRAVDTTTGEFGTAALSVQVIPGEAAAMTDPSDKHEICMCNLHLSSPAAVAIPSPSNISFRPGDMALLGLVMAALLVLCLIVIGFLISRLWKGNGSVDKICEVSRYYFLISV